MDNKESSEKKSKFRINVELIIEASSAKSAAGILQQALGRSALADNAQILQVSEVTYIPENPPEKHSEAEENSRSDLVELLQFFQEQNTLVRLSVVKNRGGNYSIPCRIIGMDLQRQAITVYHVDEKKVYSFFFNEIDDFKIS